MPSVSGLPKVIYNLLILVIYFVPQRNVNSYVPLIDVTVLHML